MMNIQNIVAGALAVAVIGCIGFKALSVIENNNSYITVKGLSDRNVIADCAMWKITVVTEANTIKEAQEKMKKDMDIVTQFLKTEGISDTEIIDTYSKTHDKFYYGGDNENTRAKRFDLKGKILIPIVKKMDPDYANNSDIKWNFTKFLVDREENVIARFAPTTDPLKIEDAIVELL